MKKFFDFENAFFRPVWIRVAIVVVCLGWAVVDYLNGHAEWAAVFVALGLYTGWQFATIDYTETPDE